MIRKIGYVFSPLVAWLATTGIAAAQTLRDPASANPEQDGVFALIGGLVIVFWLVIIVFFVIVMWKIFTKAGKPGWAAIIPIYNTIILIEIAERPIWWIILLFIPVVSLVMIIILMNDMSTRFGKGVGFTIGLLILPIIFYPILAFGKSTYQPQGPSMGMTPPPMPPPSSNQM